MNNKDTIGTTYAKVKNQSEKINEVAAALNKTQANLISAKKNSQAHRYKYADLSECWSVIRLPMADAGLSVIQTNLPTEKGITIRTTLLHVSGQWLAGEIYLPCQDPYNPQLMGSLNTYARRYALSGMFGLAPVDDDAASVVTANAACMSDKQKKLLNSVIKSKGWSVDQLKQYTKKEYDKEPGQLNNIEFNQILEVIKHD